MMDNYKVNIPVGESGLWKIEKFEVSRKGADFNNARASFSFSCRGQRIEPGTYTRLLYERTTVMSDTLSEIRDHMGIINAAKGRVLIGGLGLGMVLQACLEKPGVEHVTVIEKSSDVIKLVGEHYKAKYEDRLSIIQGDILEWKPAKGQRWDAAWFDIWNEKCGDNTDQMSTLNRRYGRRTDWKGCWGEYECREANRRWAREKKRWD